MRTHQSKMLTQGSWGTVQPAQSLRHAAPPRASLRMPRALSCSCGGSCPRCQAKSGLHVSAAADAHEHEADAVANRVMETQAVGPVSALSAGLQRQAAPAQPATPAPASVDTALRSGGESLDAETRAFFEPRFGRDFSMVRVHTGSAAAQSARDVHARAYTVGQHIVFGSGRFAPQSNSGQQLLAHELTHIVQQSGRHGGLVQRELDDSETEASDATALGAYDGDPSGVEPPVSPPPSGEAGADIAVDRDEPTPAQAGSAAAGPEITLETGNSGAGPLNNLVHQQVCVDRPERRKLCYSFAATGVQAPQFSSTWLGWSSWVAGAILQGEVYNPAPVSGASVVGTHTPTVAQADNWVDYMMSSRLGLQDGYSVARHNCRLYSQWEFRDAPSHW